MYFLIIILPLLSFLYLSLFGRYFGKSGSIIISFLFLFSSTLITIRAFIVKAFYDSSIYYVELGTWLNSEMLVVNWGLIFDSLSITMCFIITIISTIVHTYSYSYMSEDPHIIRFISFLSLFTFFMLVLVSADNFLQLFLGWEGVGLCSYLLINFWFTRLKANKSAIKAMLMNKLGDFSFFFGILTVFFLFRTLDFQNVFLLAPFMAKQNILIFNINFNILEFIAFLFFFGSVGKSAQIGLHTWLPDAMEGPSPVSALIHAATMVTAGVFLIIRCSVIFEYAPSILILCTLVGATTTFFAATSGLLQNDIKKVIAYSTCSQLGYMVFTCGLSNYALSFFHLFNHAFFKALLFLGAGSLIHSMHNEQDMRKMGGLRYLLPYTYTLMLIGSLALTGFPFLAGFYSKDIILEVAFINYTVSNKFAFLIGTISAFFTAFYSLRLLFLTFLKRNNSYKLYLQNIHEMDILMAIPLTILGFCSLSTGYIFKDLFIGLGSEFINSSIYIRPDHVYLIDSEFLPYYIKLIPTICTLLSSLLAFHLIFLEIPSVNKVKTTDLFIKVHNFLYGKWYFDYIYNKLLVKNILYLSYSSIFKFLDKGIIEVFGPAGLSNIVKNIVDRSYKFDANQLHHYIYMGIISFVFLFYLIWNI